MSPIVYVGMAMVAYGLAVLVAHNRRSAIILAERLQEVEERQMALLEALQSAVGAMQHHLAEHGTDWPALDEQGRVVPWVGRTA